MRGNKTEFADGYEIPYKKSSQGLINGEVGGVPEHSLYACKGGSSRQCYRQGRRQLYTEEEKKLLRSIIMKTAMKELACLFNTAVAENSIDNTNELRPERTASSIVSECNRNANTAKLRHLNGESERSRKCSDDVPKQRMGQQLEKPSQPTSS